MQVFPARIKRNHSRNTEATSVLVVDDDLFQANPLVINLQRAGAVVYEASNAHSAVETLREKVDIGIAIIDVMMVPLKNDILFSEEETGSGRFAGLTLAKQFESERPDLDLFLYSAYPANDAIRAWQRERSKRNFFSKTELPKLIEAIKALLHPQTIPLGMSRFVKGLLAGLITMIGVVSGAIALLGFVNVKSWEQLLTFLGL